MFAVTHPQKLDNSLTAQRREAATKQTASIVNHKASEYTGNGRASPTQPSNNARCATPTPVYC